LTPNRAATFLWRVAGQPMKETGIHDGDVVVVDRSRKPRHGDVVVASINGEVSLKLFRNDGRPTLSLSNGTQKLDADPPPYGVKLAHDEVIAANDAMTSR